VADLGAIGLERRDVPFDRHLLAHLTDLQPRFDARQVVDRDLHTRLCESAKTVGPRGNGINAGREGRETVGSRFVGGCLAGRPCLPAGLLP